MINGLLPTRNQSKEKIGKLNSNQFHKGHFLYADLDLFMYPEGQPMYFYKEYTEENDDPDKSNKIKRLYNNYYVCKHYIHNKDCLTEKQTYKTLIENGGRLERAMFLKMEKEEYKK